MKKAQVPACKEPVGLSCIDAKRPNGATLVPWARGKPMAWDVTVPDTYAQSHVNDTSIQAATAADSAAAAKKAKYTDIANNHMFIPVAIETGGPWNVEVIELIQEIERRANNTHQWRTSRNRISLSTHLNRQSKGQPSGLPEHLSNRTQFLTPRKTVSNKTNI